MVRPRRSSALPGAASGPDDGGPAASSASGSGPGTASTSHTLTLPAVRWKRFSRSAAPELGPAGVTDLSAIAFGFNDSRLPSTHQAPVPPAPVEYDMDEQDARWLSLQNELRRGLRLPLVSPEAFEVVMDRFEREWTVLMVGLTLLST